MRDVLVQEFEKGRLARIISAARGEWISGRWELSDGQVFEVPSGGQIRRLFSFKRQILNLDLSPRELETSATDPQQMNLLQLRRTIATLERQGSDATRLRVMFHLRLAVPWASVVLALLGASAGSRPQRSSSSVGLGLSVVIVFFYYVVLSLCQSLGDAAYLPALVSAWVPNVLFLILGGYMAKRANR
jgi:lipopolysaccharide export system permease protein